MSTARKLVLENRLGQRIRVLDVGSATVQLVYRLDNRRVEAHADLSVLDREEVEYRVLTTLSARDLKSDLVVLPGGLGQVRPLVEDEKSNRPVYELAPEDDDTRLQFALKKTSIGHAVAVAALILLSFIMAPKTKEEPQLVTITVPKPAPQPKQVQRVQVAQKKIQRVQQNIKKVAQRTVVRPKSQVKVAKTKPKVTAPVRRVVHTERPRSMKNVGALAALGGVKNGARGAEGLDARSLRNIRSAGTGSGGGGVGGYGAGGTAGVLPGSGLIAGSRGSGARAAGAGGYGTKGVGGGRAGYGKISLVGNVGGLSLPLDDEATIEGGLDRDQIAAVINRNLGQIIYCYEQGLQGRPNLRGRVSVDFVIGASGRVTRAKVSDTSLNSAQVEGCMVARLRTWQFPRPVGAVNVDVLYPFELRRVSSR